jgi:hypothetical protein
MKSLLRDSRCDLTFSNFSSSDLRICVPNAAHVPRDAPATQRHHCQLSFRVNSRYRPIFANIRTVFSFILSEAKDLLLVSNLRSFVNDQPCPTLWNHTAEANS